MGSDKLNMIELRKMPDLVKNALTYCTEPVSYTHLDVYKRQGQSWC